MVAFKRSTTLVTNSTIATTRAHCFNPDKLIAKTFLCERDVNGTIHRTEIVEYDKHSELITDQCQVKFGDGEREEVMTYNAIVNHLTKQIDKEEEGPDSIFSFKCISNH